MLAGVWRLGAWLVSRFHLDQGDHLSCKLLIFLKLLPVGYFLTSRPVLYFGMSSSLNTPKKECLG